MSIFWLMAEATSSEIWVIEENVGLLNVETKSVRLHLSSLIFVFVFRSEANFSIRARVNTPGRGPRSTARRPMRDGILFWFRFMISFSIALYK